jgi:hypothetical protein
MQLSVISEHLPPALTPAALIEFLVQEKRFFMHFVVGAVCDYLVNK